MSTSARTGTPQLAVQTADELVGRGAVLARAQRRVDRQHRGARRHDLARTLERRRDVDVGARQRELAQADHRELDGARDRLDVGRALGADPARSAGHRGLRHGRHVGGRAQRTARRRLAGDDQRVAQALQGHGRGLRRPDEPGEDPARLGRDQEPRAVQRRPGRRDDAQARRPLGEQPGKRRRAGGPRPRTGRRPTRRPRARRRRTSARPRPPRSWPARRPPSPRSRAPPRRRRVPRRPPPRRTRPPGAPAPRRRRSPRAARSKRPKAASARARSASDPPRPSTARSALARPARPIAKPLPASPSRWPQPSTNATAPPPSAASATLPVPAATHHTRAQAERAEIGGHHVARDHDARGAEAPRELRGEALQVRHRVGEARQPEADDADAAGQARLLGRRRGSPPPRARRLPATAGGARRARARSGRPAAVDDGRARCGLARVDGQRRSDRRRSDRGSLARLHGAMVTGLDHMTQPAMRPLRDKVRQHQIARLPGLYQSC